MNTGPHNRRATPPMGLARLAILAALLLIPVAVGLAIGPAPAYGRPLAGAYTGIPDLWDDSSGCEPGDSDCLFSTEPPSALGSDYFTANRGSCWAISSGVRAGKSGAPAPKAILFEANHNQVVQSSGTFFMGCGLTAPYAPWTNRNNKDLNQKVCYYAQTYSYLCPPEATKLIGGDPLTFWQSQWSAGNQSYHLAFTLEDGSASSMTISNIRFIWDDYEPPAPTTTPTPYAPECDCNGYPDDACINNGPIWSSNAQWISETIGLEIDNFFRTETGDWQATPDDVLVIPDSVWRIDVDTRGESELQVWFNGYITTTIITITTSSEDWQRTSRQVILPALGDSTVTISSTAEGTYDFSRLCISFLMMNTQECESPTDGDMEPGLYSSCFELQDCLEGWAEDDTDLLYHYATSNHYGALRGPGSTITAPVSLEGHTGVIGSYGLTLRARSSHNAKITAALGTYSATIAPEFDWVTYTVYFSGLESYTGNLIIRTDAEADVDNLCLSFYPSVEILNYTGYLPAPPEMFIVGHVALCPPPASNDPPSGYDLWEWIQWLATELYNTVAVPSLCYLDELINWIIDHIINAIIVPFINFVQRQLISLWTWLTVTLWGWLIGYQTWLLARWADLWGWLTNLYTWLTVTYWDWLLARWADLWGWLTDLYTWLTITFWGWLTNLYTWLTVTYWDWLLARWADLWEYLTVTLWEYMYCLLMTMLTWLVSRLQTLINFIGAALNALLALLALAVNTLLSWWATVVNNFLWAWGTWAGILLLWCNDGLNALLSWLIGVLLQVIYDFLGIARFVMGLLSWLALTVLSLLSMLFQIVTNLFAIIGTLFEGLRLAVTNDFTIEVDIATCTDPEGSDIMCKIYAGLLLFNYGIGDYVMLPLTIIVIGMTGVKLIQWTMGEFGHIADVLKS